HPKKLVLVVDVETVAALALHGGDPECKHLFQESRGFVAQLLLGGLPGLAHRRGDAAAALRNVEIAPAPKPLVEFVGSPAAKGQVGMAVDQPWYHQPPTGIDSLGSSIGRWQVLLGTD